MESVAARGARGEGRRAPLRHHVPGGREAVQRRDPVSGGRHACPARLRSSSTTRTGWRSTSRKRWRASTASESTAKVSRARWSSSASARAQAGRARRRPQVVPVYQDTGWSRDAREFLGLRAVWKRLRGVVGLVDGSASRWRRSPAGATVELVFDQTPFYAEAGGQVGDRGRPLLRFGREGGERADGLSRPVPGLTRASHRHARAGAGRRRAARGSRAAPLRDATRRNHTATHLLHAALRQVLGTHVKQAGSVVEPARLRFDFTHYAAMDRAEIEEVERLVNAADPAEYAGGDQRDGARSGDRDRGDGAVR